MSYFITYEAETTTSEREFGNSEISNHDIGRGFTGFQSINDVRRVEGFIKTKLEKSGRMTYNRVVLQSWRTF